MRVFLVGSGGREHALGLRITRGPPCTQLVDPPAADAFIDAQPGAVVVKADGLAAGKGVVVTSTKAEAKAAVRAMLDGRAFGEAGARVVIEERLSGREVTMMALCDGTRLALL